MRMIFLAILLGLSNAWAHTAVEAITPGAYASVSAPQTVVVTLSEAVDLHFATFKVYPLKASGDRLALNRAAARLAATALKTRDDQALRADSFNLKQGEAAKVTIPLKPNLARGPYVVMWQILSDDGHVMTGQSIFTVK